MIANNDEDVLRSKSAALLVSQLQPRTYFGAITAKQITNDTVSQSGQRNFAGRLIGDSSKNCVKSVSIFVFKFYYTKFELNP